MQPNFVSVPKTRMKQAVSSTNPKVSLWYVPQGIMTIFLFGILFMVLSSCSEVHYYYQAVDGHLNILNKKRSIDELIQSEASPPDLVHKLKLIGEVRQFATEHLHLPQVEGYTSYSDIGKSHVSTVVHAAPELSLKPYKWCFLFVGCVSYRGYFNEEEAQILAEDMKSKGYDVYVRKVKAYSTLKWLNNPYLPDYFSDPVLNTFIKRDESAIISTLIHEMAHQVVWVNGDTSFNESFAVFVEGEGLKQFLASKNHTHSEEYQKYLNQQKDKLLFLSIVNQHVDQLNAMYDSDLSRRQKLKRKQEIIASMKQTYQQRKHEFVISTYDNWFGRELNNAMLSGIRTYTNRVDAFQVVFESSQQDWKRFFERVKEIAEMDKAQREQYLDSLTNHAPVAPRPSPDQTKPHAASRHPA